MSKLKEKLEQIVKSWKNYVKKFSCWKSLEELLIVVIGIGLTLWATNWYKLQQDKENMQHYLKVLKEELQDNKKSVDTLTVWLEKEAGYSRYINSLSKNDAASRDSVKFYNISAIRNIWTVTYAFKMLTIPDLRLITNTDFIQSVWKAYNSLEVFRIEMDYYIQNKSTVWERQKVKEPIPMYEFYVADSHNSSRPGKMLEKCAELKSSLDAAIKIVEKEITLK